MGPEEKEPKEEHSESRGGRLLEERSLWVAAVVLFALGALAGTVWLLWSNQAPPARHKEVAPPPAVPKPAPPPAAGSKVAIVIDDLGGNLRAAHELIRLGEPLTFAVLPKLPHSREIDRAASQAGREVLLHLPMEPFGYPEKNPGPGALLGSMSAEKMLAVLEEDLEDVPHSIGVNNHMGSLLTEDEEVMRRILSYVKERKLFFLDSYTTPRSVVEEVAGRLGLPSASRHVFLDHVPYDEEYVDGQMDKLVEAAKEHGVAIGIGHPHQATIAALKKRLPTLAQEGVSVVPISLLVKHPPTTANSSDGTQ